MEQPLCHQPTCQHTPSIDSAGTTAGVTISDGATDEAKLATQDRSISSRRTTLMATATIEILMSVFLVGTAVVQFWRGLWLLQDYYLYQDDRRQSAWASFVIGSIMSVAASFVALAGSASEAKVGGVTAYIIGLLFNWFVGAAAVFYWRGIWHVTDAYVADDDASQRISAWVSHFVGGLGLILLGNLSAMRSPPVGASCDLPSIYPCYGQSREQEAEDGSNTAPSAEPSLPDWFLRGIKRQPWHSMAVSVARLSKEPLLPLKNVFNYEFLQLPPLRWRTGNDADKHNTVRKDHPMQRRRRRRSQSDSAIATVRKHLFRTRRGRHPAVPELETGSSSDAADYDQLPTGLAPPSHGRTERLWRSSVDALDDGHGRQHSGSDTSGSTLVQDRRGVHFAVSDHLSSSADTQSIPSRRQGPETSPTGRSSASHTSLI